MNEVEKLVVIAYAENGMDAAKAGRAISYCRNSIVYHIKEIYRKYGLNPQRFDDLVQLVKRARGEDVPSDLEELVVQRKVDSSGTVSYSVTRRKAG